MSALSALFQELETRQRELDDLSLRLGQLKAAEADRVQNAYQRAVESLGDSTKAARWLLSKVRLLGGRRPMDVALLDNDGLELVCYVLTQIEYGGPA